MTNNYRYETTAMSYRPWLTRICKFAVCQFRTGFLTCIISKTSRIPYTFLFMVLKNFSTSFGNGIVNQKNFLLNFRQIDRKMSEKGHFWGKFQPGGWHKMLSKCILEEIILKNKGFIQFFNSFSITEVTKANIIRHLWRKLGMSNNLHAFMPPKIQSNWLVRPKIQKPGLVFSPIFATNSSKFAF